MTDAKRVEKDILKDIEKMNEEFDLIRQRYQDEAQKKMKGVFAEVFQDFPDLKIMWRQYTQSWNDGEECSFSVYEPSITNLEDERLQEAIDSCQSEYEGDDDDVFSGYGDWVPDMDQPEPEPDRWGYKRSRPTKEVGLDEARARPFFWIDPRKITDDKRSPVFFQNADKAAIKKLTQLLQLMESGQFEEVMEQTFGNGSYVVASAAGFEIDDYSDA